MTTLKEYYAQKSGSWQELAEAQNDEIERLRGLLHDGTEIATTDSPYETGTKARMRKWVARVREALGDSP